MKSVLNLKSETGTQEWVWHFPTVWFGAVTSHLRNSQCLHTTQCCNASHVTGFPWWNDRILAPCVRLCKDNCIHLMRWNLLLAQSSVIANGKSQLLLLLFKKKKPLNLMRELKTSLNLSSNMPNNWQNRGTKYETNMIHLYYLHMAKCKKWVPWISLWCIS